VKIGWMLAAKESALDALQPQRPSTQLWPTPQLTLQPPQCARLLLVSTHAPPHGVPPPGQRQPPFSQTRPPLQVTPQPPQWLGFEITLTHDPPQFAVPAGQPH
jgi:hypothetical protein